MKKDEVIVKIARILLRQDAPNWTWEVVNCVLKAKYHKAAEELYDMLKHEDLIK